MSATSDTGIKGGVILNVGREGLSGTGSFQDMVHRDVVARFGPHHLFSTL